MKQRIVTGLLAGSVFLAALWLGGYGFASLIFVLSVIGFGEFLRMNKLQTFTVGTVISFAALARFTFPYFPVAMPGMPFDRWLWLLMFLLFAVTVLSRNKLTLDHVALYLLGVVYIGAGFYFMAATRLGEHGLFWTLLVFSCIWLTDSGAYFAGYFFGKHPLWPAISPKKTVEGALGGTVLSVISAVCFSLYAPQLLSAGRAVLLGLVIAVIGQMGDLIQSAYKRVRGIKDTGAILPGHGGVLDRTDSWLIVFPFLHLLMLVPNT